MTALSEAFVRCTAPSDAFAEGSAECRLQFHEARLCQAVAVVDEATRQIGDLCVVKVVVLGDHGDLPAVHGKDSYVRHGHVRIVRGGAVGPLRPINP